MTIWLDFLSLFCQYSIPRGQFTTMTEAPQAWDMQTATTVATPKHEPTDPQGETTNWTDQVAREGRDIHMDSNSVGTGDDEHNHGDLDRRQTT